MLELKSCSYGAYLWLSLQSHSRSVGHRMVYREKKLKGTYLFRVYFQVFFHNCSFSLLLVLSSSCFPFILFFTSLPYKYLFRILICVMQILISYIDQEKNPTPTHKKEKNKNTTPSLFPPASTPQKSTPVCIF